MSAKRNIKKWKDHSAEEYRNRAVDQRESLHSSNVWLWRQSIQIINWNPSAATQVKRTELQLKIQSIGAKDKRERRPYQLPRQIAQRWDGQFLKRKKLIEGADWAAEKVTVKWEDCLEIKITELQGDIVWV